MHFFHSLKSYCELPFSQVGVYNNNFFQVGICNNNFPDLWPEHWSVVLKCSPDMGDKIPWNTLFNISIGDFTISKLLQKNTRCFTHEIITSDDRLKNQTFIIKVLRWGISGAGKVLMPLGQTCLFACTWHGKDSWSQKQRPQYRGKIRSCNQLGEFEAAIALWRVAKGSVPAAGS